MLGNGTWLVFLPLAPIKTSSAGLLILAFITVMLSITCLLLLGHLLGFHFYLCESQSSRLTFDRARSPSSNHQCSPFSSGVCSPLGFTVYKGISTYDYVKMQRQKEARNRDAEAGNPHDAKVINKAPQVRPVLCLPLSVTGSFSHVCVKLFFSFFKRIKRAQLTVSQHYRRVQGKTNSFQFLLYYY